MSKQWLLESLECRRMLSADLVADTTGVSPHDSVTAANGETFFIANDGIHGDQLWASDGTIVGTHLVKVIADGGITAGKIVAFGDGAALFESSAATGVQLWTSDGTDAGTVEIADAPLGENVLQSSLVSVNNQLTFLSISTADAHSATIWASDGTVGNVTAIQQLNGVNVETDLDTYIDAPAVIGDRVIYTNIYPAEPATGELWSTDGTAAGTFQLGGTDVWGAGQLSQGGKYLFWEYNVGLFSTDGTLAGTQQIATIQVDGPTYGETSIDPSEIASYNGCQTIADGQYFFTPPGQHGDVSTDVWESDGTAAGTHLAFTVPGVFNEVATSSNGVVVFAENIRQITGAGGYSDVGATSSLYHFDPASGQLTPFYQFTDLGIPKNVITVDGSVYFFYWDGATQQTSESITYADMKNFQLWKSDGTTAGTQFIQTYTYWPELTQVGDDLVVSDQPNQPGGKQIIEPADPLDTPSGDSGSDSGTDSGSGSASASAGPTPVIVQGMTQDAVSLVGGVLRVFGTDSDDSIRIYQQDADRSRLVVDLNGVKNSFPIGDISEIKVYGEDGDDSIAIVERHGKIGIRTYIDGGDGNDTIYTGGGRDTIYGGNGDDTINSGNNDDTIYGGAGDDHIIGGNGSDTIDAGDGANFIEGNKGDNQIIGGTDGCTDTINEAGGQDVLFGKTALDVFYNGTKKIDPLDTILSDESSNE